MDKDTIKIILANSGALGFSFSDAHFILQITSLLFATIYTFIKIWKSWVVVEEVSEELLRLFSPGVVSSIKSVIPKSSAAAGRGGTCWTGLGFKGGGWRDGGVSWLDRSCLRRSVCCCI